MGARLGNVSGRYNSPRWQLILALFLRCTVACTKKRQPFVTNGSVAQNQAMGEGNTVCHLWKRVCEVKEKEGDNGPICQR